MIRPVTSNDVEAVLEVAAAIGFEVEELAALRPMVEAFTRGEADGQHWACVDEGEGPVAVAFYRAEAFTVGTWNLVLLAVRPERHGGGHGTALVRHVEQQLTAAGERLLIIETSGLDEYAPARGLYRKLGYEEEARLREFYDAGDDKIVFWKKLTG